MYLGHSPFHSGSVELVWNPTTVIVSPQYHVVFDDYFSTTLYMEADTIPPNWEDLVKNSPEMSTTKHINLADTWLNGQSAVGATDQLSDPFAMVNDHIKRRKTDTPGYYSPSSNINISDSEGDNYPGNISSHSQHKHMNNAADN